MNKRGPGESFGKNPTLVKGLCQEKEQGVGIKGKKTPTVGRLWCEEKLHTFKKGLNTEELWERRERENPFPTNLKQR